MADVLHRLIGRSRAIEMVRERIRRLAASPIAVLILGESGTGKELCAEALGALSGRTGFYAVNCAAIPENLVESELFGHERGAFTGAVRAHAGILAEVHGGTLFLDELAEIPLPVQAKLLRTLESGEYRPVGATRTERSEFRILAATHEDPWELAAAGRLREDLLHRLGMAAIRLPALRERPEDIGVLAAEFLGRYRERGWTGATRLAVDAEGELLAFAWPGNVRQLKSVVEAAAVLAGDADTVTRTHVLEILGGPRPAERVHAMRSLAEVRQEAEDRAIAEALRLSGGNRGRAATMLGISEATLYRKLMPRSA